MHSLAARGGMTARLDVDSISGTNARKGSRSLPSKPSLPKETSAGGSPT
jgi:hypothetical protein